MEVMQRIIKQAGRFFQHSLVSRVVQAILVSFFLLTIVFFLLRLIPGDPAMVLLGENASMGQVEEYRKLLGIDRPPMEQYVDYMSSAFRGDLGVSILRRQSVVKIIASRLPVSLWLAGSTVVMVFVLALPLGLLAAVYHRTWFGTFFRVTTSVAISTPIYFTSLVILLLLAVKLDLVPIAGYDPEFPKNLRTLFAPALTNSILLAPVLARILQASVIDTMEEEFIEAAIVRGVKPFRFMWHYLLRPSLAPCIAALGYFAATVVSYGVLIEIIFNLPGVGMSLIEFIRAFDYTAVQGFVALTGLLVVATTLLADLLNAWLDPRANLQ